MAILRNSKVGNHENVTILKFGSGDIDVVEGHLKDSPHIAVLYFVNNNGDKEIGYEENLNEASSNEHEDLPVTMEFDNPESVDVVIAQLQKCKKRLNNLTSSNNTDSDK